MIFEMYECTGGCELLNMSINNLQVCQFINIMTILIPFVLTVMGIRVVIKIVMNANHDKYEKMKVPKEIKVKAKDGRMITLKAKTNKNNRWGRGYATRS